LITRDRPVANIQSQIKYARVEYHMCKYSAPSPQQVTEASKNMRDQPIDG